MKFRYNLVGVSLFIILSSCYVASLADTQDTTTPSQSESTTKLVDTILYPHDPSPEGIYRWSEGTTLNLDDDKHLLMVVSAFDQGGHDFTTPARLLEFHSYNGGLTWTPLEEAKVFQKNIGQSNVMSPSLVKLSNGNILAFFNVNNVSRKDGGPWVKRSDDGGTTWSQPKSLPYEGFTLAPSDRAIQLKNGRVLLPVWQYRDGATSSCSFCFYSDDLGKTWKKSNAITAPKGSSGGRVDPAAEEPMVVALRDGRLKMFLRTYLGSFYVSYSDDDGTTWSNPTDSGIPAPGSMPAVKRLPTGDLLLIYNWGKPEMINGPWPRNFFASAISQDDGKNFSTLRFLDGGPEFNGKITMANFTVCGGNVVVTYSKSRTKKNMYNWRLQVIPIQWFYKGDKTKVYGEKCLKNEGAKQ